MKLARPSNGEPNDVAMRFVPLVKDSIAVRDEQLEIMRRKGDFAINPFGPKKNKPAAKFNVRHFLSKEALVHAVPSPCSYTEQLETRRRVHAESNSHFANQGCFLPITGLAA